MILDIQFRVIIDDETLKEYLQYRVDRGWDGNTSGWSEWTTVQHFMGSKPKDLENIFYAQGT